LERVDASEKTGGEAMLKLRVEWHHRCPSCGVQLVVDFLDDSADCSACPWCGHLADVNMHTKIANDLRDDLARAAKELEETANDRLTAKP